MINAVDLMDLIRRRAYEIWESEGRPHGRHVIHWLRAEIEIGEISKKTQELNLPVKRARKSTRKSAALSRPQSKSAQHQQPKH